MSLFVALLGSVLLAISYGVYFVFILPMFSPLKDLPGPEPPRGLGWNGHLLGLLNSSKSRIIYWDYVQKYGRNMRIKGIGNWEDRLLTSDRVALAHVMNHSSDYQKPWPTRRLIMRFIGEGMLAAEGAKHKRMRRVGTPAFSIQNLRALVPVVYNTAQQLKEKWNEILDQNLTEDDASEKDSGQIKGVRLDVCHWISRATFDVIGFAGFDYNFQAIQIGGNELFQAYKDMFELAVSQGTGVWDVLILYLPWLDKVFPTYKTRIVKKSHAVIQRYGNQLIQEKKRRILEREKNGSGFVGRDLLSLLLKSNMSTETPPDQRISDEDMLDNVNTFFFAGSDTTSLALTWVVYLIATHPDVQVRLREEFRSVANLFEYPPDLEDLTAWQDLWEVLDELPYLNNVILETVRIIPSIHSSIRVAMHDDVIPTTEPVKMRDGSLRSGIKIKKGQLVQIPIEGINTDKEIWGEDAWKFDPDRWDNLPELAKEQIGYNHVLSWFAGSRVCIGLKFSLIEMKTFVFTIYSNFSLDRIEGERIFAANVVLTRPYVSGKFREGSQLPLKVSRLPPATNQ